MKKRTGSIIALALCIIMVLTMVISSVAVFATQTYAAADPKSIDKVIVDFRSAAAFEKTGGMLYVHGTANDAQLYHGGKTSFNAENKALKLEYFPDTAGKNGGHPYRLMSHVNKGKALTEEYKYFVIVYKAKSDAKYDVTLWNTPGRGQKVVIAEGASGTDGKWAVSDPHDISLAGEDGSSILSRWVEGAAINALYVKTSDPNMEFYIKEYAFFKTAEDAKAYYAAADLEKDPAEYMTEAQKKAFIKTTTASGDALTVKGEGLVTVTYKEYTLEDHGLSEETDDNFEGELPAPVIMNFSNLLSMTESGVYQTDHSGNTEGTFGFTTLDDGTGCIKLTYSVPDTGAWAAYRMMPAFNGKIKPTVQHKYMRITYMTPDPMSASITVTNNVQAKLPITLVEDTSLSKGQWIISNAVDITGAGILQRYIEGKHCTIGYTAISETATVYIKEIAFFATKAQAYEYYGDKESVSGSDMSVMTFGTEGTGDLLRGENYGVYVEDDENNTVNVIYAEKTGHGVNYMAKIKFKNKDFIDKNHRYMRVLYSAKHPEGVNEQVAMYMRNDGVGGDIIRVQKNMKDTSGEYVLSDTVLLSPDMIDRLANKTIHCSLWVTTTLQGGEYSIKAVYFFPTKKAADEFDFSIGKSSVTVLGNDISKYQIVVPADEPFQIMNSAENIVAHIENISGVKLNIVTDRDPVSDYEIILGLSDREETKAIYKEIENDDPFKYVAKTVGNKLVIVAGSHFAASDGADVLLDSYLYRGKTVVPSEITVDKLFEHTAKSAEMKAYTAWTPVTNVADPDVFFDDFSSDNGYFTEENNGSDWKIADGKLSVAAGAERKLTYLHVYEENAAVSAKLSYKSAGNNADFGLMLRYTAEEAYVRAGYDFKNGEWYIESREGDDFPAIRKASVKAALTEGAEYYLSFTADKDTASLYVNGENVLTASGIRHITPGRIAVYAKDIALSADDLEAVLLSGLGTVMKNVVHNRLPDERYREGGSVFELLDGTLIYQHAMTAGFKSTDGGATWQRLDNLFLNTDGTYPQVLRLNNGELLQIRFGNVGGAKSRYAVILNEDGTVKEQRGVINYTTYPNSKANNLNMNDKVTQMSDGRIFYVQNYNAGSTANNYLGKYQVFDGIYYSDDNGKTWKESDTATFEIPGNEDMEFFAESKIMECADGTLRLYNSWNTYGCVVYSESTDNGVTWGQIQTLPEFVCARSSMQFMRDPYGETDTTYYMVWVNSVPYDNKGNAMTRARLSLAKTTDGKNWEFIGDLWHWKHNFTHEGALLAHIVDPFVQCTKDSIIVGTGLAEYLPVNGDGSASYHGAQRQHIWTIDRETVVETAKPMNKFTDIALGAPYYEAVTYVSDAGLFNGTSDTTFAPDNAMTRSMFVTVLGRLDGADVSAYAVPTFNDVAAGQWYTAYVEWAAANGIVNGLGNGIYGINDNVTVQQACVILARYADYAEAKTAAGKTLESYPDSASVADWASKEMAWAVANGIYDGLNGVLSPNTPATRAVVAEMFKNYSEAYK